MTERFIALPGASLDLLGACVLRNGEPVKVEPRAWRVLEQLARFRHRVVTKEELLAALGPEGEVSDGALRQAVLAARRAIGDEGPEPIIRSIPRVGYILDVPAAQAPERPPAGPLPEGIPSVIIGPLRNETGAPGLAWSAHGLVACIAHGLSIDGRLQVQDAQSLNASWPDRQQRLLQMLRAAGARYAVVGSLRIVGSELALELHVHDHDEETVVQVRAAALAGLVVPAVEALLQQLLGAGARGARANELRRCSLLSIELFARAKHCAALHRHAAALRALQLLQRLEPGFPRLDLELLRFQAICGSDDGPASAQRLLEAARRDGDKTHEAQVREWIGSLHIVKGQLREGAQSLEQALVLGRHSMPPHWQGQILTLLASVGCRLGELHSVQARLDEAQMIFTRIGSHWALLNVLWVRAVMSSLSGHAEQSIRWNRKLASAARRLNANTALVNVCLNLAGELVYADRLDEARACAEEATATALAIEAQASLLHIVVNIHCLVHRQQGRPDAAAELLSLLSQPAEVQDEGYLWQAHGHAAMAAGRVDEAADNFLRAAAEFRGRANRMAEAPLLPWLVEALVLSGRLQLAQAELDRAGTQPHLQDESTTANLLYPRALLARRHRQEPEAQALLARLATAPAALPLFRRLGRELSAMPVDPPGMPSVSITPPNRMMRCEYRFASCVVDVERRELWVDGRRHTMAPKPFDVLVHLVRNRHRVVTRDELLDTVWDEASGSPEVIAQAIAKIRQVMRRSKTHAVRVETVHGKGFRLLADARVEPSDDTATALLSEQHLPQQQRLAVVPLPDQKPAVRMHDHDFKYPLEVLGYTLAVHSQRHLVSAAEVRETLDASAVATPEAIAAALAGRMPGVQVLFARMARRGEALSLDYVLVSPAARIEGSMLDRSPTALGRRLAAKLLRHLHADSVQARIPAAEGDVWVSQMVDLASRAAEERRWDEALSVLDVVLDQDPDHALAADLKARITTLAGGTARETRACPRFDRSDRRGGEDGHRL
jgi:DNA-binding winged helix-turn-helix (wHTH) protein